MLTFVSFNVHTRAFEADFRIENSFVFLKQDPIKRQGGIDWSVSYQFLARIEKTKKGSNFSKQQNTADLAFSASFKTFYPYA